MLQIDRRSPEATMVPSRCPAFLGSFPGFEAQLLWRGQMRLLTCEIHG